ncbi:putative reverse transcriptase domain-containing protein [Tanacetum coccineum]
MVDEHHEEVLKASTSKGVECQKNNANHDDNENGSSSSSGDHNFKGFTDEETKVLSSVIKKQVGKAIKNVMPYNISKTTDNLKEIFDGTLNPIASTRWLSVIKGAFRTNSCKEKNKGEEWIGSCTWKEFKELFNAEYAPIEEVDKIQEEFQTLMQTNETVNELWKKFNDLIRYCLEYHGNEKLKVREANLQRKENKEAKETKRKLEFGNRDAKKPKQDHSKKSSGTQIKTPCKKCHKAHLGECQANLPGCYKCGALNHMSKDCKKLMILCYNCNQLGHKSNEYLNPKVTEAKPMKSMKEEKVEKAGVSNPKARVYVMAAEEGKVVHDVVTGTILVISLPAYVLYDLGASVSFVSHEFSKNLPAPPNKLLFPLEVEIAGSEVVVVSNVYRDEIEIDDIQVVNPQGREIVIYGDKKKGDFKLCSIMKARKYLSRGCYAYIAHMIDTSFEKKSLEDVPIVNELLDVFPEDFLGIPPERKVEF